MRTRPLLCGKKIATLRTQQKLSQRALADRLQLVGLDVDKNAINRIESGQRFVTDIELMAFARLFEVSLEELVTVE